MNTLRAVLRGKFKISNICIKIFFQNLKFLPLMIQLFTRSSWNIKKTQTENNIEEGMTSQCLTY